jgi:hypothetical protein
MLNISKLLGRFSDDLKSGEELKLKTLELIQEITGISLTKEKIEIKDCILMVDASPAVKNKLFIYKEKILESLGNISSSKIIDLR